MRLPGCEGLIDRFLIDMGQHQNFTRNRVLGNGGQQAGSIEFGDELAALFYFNTMGHCATFSIFRKQGLEHS